MRSWPRRTLPGKAGPERRWTGLRDATYWERPPCGQHAGGQDAAGRGQETTEQPVGLRPDPASPPPPTSPTGDGAFAVFLRGTSFSIKRRYQVAEQQAPPESFLNNKINSLKLPACEQRSKAAVMPFDETNEQKGEAACRGAWLSKATFSRLEGLGLVRGKSAIWGLRRKDCEGPWKACNKEFDKT